MSERDKCESCGVPIDSLEADGNAIFWGEDWDSPERLCYECQWDYNDCSVVVDGGITQEQKLKSQAEGHI